MGRAERAFLVGSCAVIAAVAVFVGSQVWIASQREPDSVAGPLPPEPPTPRPLPAPPAKEPPLHIVVSGRLVDLPGIPIDPAILRWTRVSLVTGEQSWGEKRPPEADGSFHLEGDAPLPGLHLRVSTDLRLPLFDRSLDRTLRRDVAVTATRMDLGEVPLPRSEELGSIVGKVVDAAGRPVLPLSLELDAVEGTSTPDIGLARLGSVLDHASNAPTLYREGARFTILHVPPGKYWLRARADNRLIPAVVVSVGPLEARVSLAEVTTRRRIRGALRDARERVPLGGVEVSVSTADYVGPATRDPLRVIGRTSIDGLYDLPLPEALPERGVLVSFSKRGYRTEELRLGGADFGGELVVRRHLELGPE